MLSSSSSSSSSKENDNKQNEDIILFEGNVVDACKYFPQNVNVSAAILLASKISVNNMKVKIIASPLLKYNCHYIDCFDENESFGKIQIKIENVPDSNNPKSSKLAAMSLIASLNQLVSHVKIV